MYFPEALNFGVSGCNGINNLLSGSEPRREWVQHHQPPPETHAEARSLGGVAGLLPRDGQSLGANVSGIPEKLFLRKALPYHLIGGLQNTVAVFV